MKAVEGNMHII